MRRGACLAALVLLLAACAGPAQRPAAENPQQAWQHRRQTLATLTQWDFDARVSVRQGQEGGSGSLHWRQRGADSALQGSGPLGRGAFRLDAGPDGGRLELADGRFLEDSDTARLLQTALGLEVPVSALRFWALGLPAPGAASQRRLDGAGLLTRLRQSGWTVEYLAYAPIRGGPPLELPAKLRASSGNLELRLTIKSWAFPGPDDAPP